MSGGSIASAAFVSVDTVSVVAGGWSVGKVDRERIPGLIIGVNDAAVHLPHCDIAVSMDRLWTEYRWAQILGRLAWIRRSAIKNRHDRWDGLTIFECDHTSAVFTEEQDRLNGTNSGLCGLNLAYRMKPRRIVLWGFDMRRAEDGRSYWFDPYPWAPQGATKPGKYQEWAGQFHQAAETCKAAGIEVLNASPQSAIRVFRKVDPSEVYACGM